MRKFFTFTVFLLITTLLIACGTDNEGNAENNANKPENEKVNNGDNNNLVINDDEDTNENSNEDGNSDESANSGKYKEDVLDRYPDDMRLGDTQEWDRSDGVGQDHIELTLNSFKLVDELDGVKPKNDIFFY